MTPLRPRSEQRSRSRSLVTEDVVATLVTVGVTAAIIVTMLAVGAG